MTPFVGSLVYFLLYGFHGRSTVCSVTHALVILLLCGPRRQGLVLFTLWLLPGVRMVLRQMVKELIPILKKWFLNYFPFPF
jgi:hypothetical protein